MQTSPDTKIFSYGLIDIQHQRGKPAGWWTESRSTGTGSVCVWTETTPLPPQSSPARGGGRKRRRMSTGAKELKVFWLEMFKAEVQTGWLSRAPAEGLWEFSLPPEPGFLYIYHSASLLTSWTQKCTTTGDTYSTQTINILLSRSGAY